MGWFLSEHRPIYRQKCGVGKRKKREVKQLLPQLRRKDVGGLTDGLQMDARRNLRQRGLPHVR